MKVRLISTGEVGWVNSTSWSDVNQNFMFLVKVQKNASWTLQVWSATSCEVLP